MDLRRLTDEELKYELKDTNNKLSDMINSKNKGLHFKQKKFNSYLNYKREILREMRRRTK